MTTGPGPDPVRRRIGVLVMAHGTPADPGEIEPFYTRIRRGRPPSAEQLADLVRRYDAIGGTSPLAARTAAQVDAVAASLERGEPGRFQVSYGAKHVEPSIETAAVGLAASGVGLVVGLVLAPHRAGLGSAEYLARAGAALAATPEAPPFVPVLQWYDASGFAPLLAERVRRALAVLGAPGSRAPSAPVVVFTAHSLPERVIAAGDPYPEQLAESAAAVAGAAGLEAAGIAWRVAWQSAGRTAEPWIGPDILDVVRRLPSEGFDGVVVCPIGFVSDHLEVLFDLDVEARGVAEGAGLAFGRTASLDDDPRFVEILAEVVRTAAGPGADR
ncbi:MAG: ferrochelatase [Acidimicrobiales bacterium]